MVAVAVLGLAGTGALAQGVSFSGSASMGVIYAGKHDTDTSKANGKFSWLATFDLGISAEGTTDGGLTFGASTSIDSDGAGTSASTDPVDASGDAETLEPKTSLSGSHINGTVAYIGGESWKISIGDLDPASHKGRSLGDVGYEGLGVDDVAENAVSSLGADVEVSFNLGGASLALTAVQSGGGAEKQKTEWAAGVGFGVGSTNLGIGMDSEKLMQASVSADLGAFGGSIFYAQQKVDGPTDTMDSSYDGTIPETDTDENDEILTNKKTGIGVEITVSAGENTTINAVYAQGKQSDTRTGFSSEASAADDNVLDPVAQTDKGFGVGVSHNLGGGATLQAGFGKVKKQTMASVGVSMSF